jgi:hypothetical protein
VIAWILGYLLVGDAVGLALYFWAAVYCWRFVGNVRPRWTDLAVVVLAQLLWPIAMLVLCPYTSHRWRRAVQNEICLCGHRRADHDGVCNYKIRSARWLVNGEGDEFFYCECPVFTLPNVRPRR